MTRKEYKKIIDDFITRRYKHLVECATNILKRNKTNGGDMVSELTLYLYDNQTKLEDYIDMDMLEGFSVSWMRLQAQYKSTPFSRKYNNTSEEVKPGKETSTTDGDIEHLNEDEYITDLRTTYNDNQIENILKIHDIYPTLSKSHKILFDAYFLENLSYEKIKNKYTFYETKNGKTVYYRSRTSISKLMTELKNEIKKKL